MTRPQTCIVITSVNPPTNAIKMLVDGARERGIHLIVVGDVKSPIVYDEQGVEFVSITDQLNSDSRLALLTPSGHYARKNLGYLMAIERGTEIIVDTDDDNLPLPSFFDVPQRFLDTDSVNAHDWVNIYAYFANGAVIWPRGFPLDGVKVQTPLLEEAGITEFDCPIQQGLADVDPDVDAIYRLVAPLPFRFNQRRPISLSAGSWCPFNSQNTTWFRDAFPLLYLPSYCSFRMTDIWRSLIAQRIAWENDWRVAYHSPTVWQERNEHDLMKDFTDEIPGYLNNRSIAKFLEGLEIRPGTEHLGEALMASYDGLIGLGLIGKEELQLLEAWLTDLANAPI